jgi:hypothetical protein
MEGGQCCTPFVAPLLFSETKEETELSTCKETILLDTKAIHLLLSCPLPSTRSSSLHLEPSRDECSRASLIVAYQ